MRSFLSSFWKKPLVGLVLVSFLVNTLFLSTPVAAQMLSKLPVPGALVPLSVEHDPVMIKGIILHPEDPLKVGFVIDKAATDLNDQEVKEEYQRLIKYFFAALTVPDSDMWVNLSPYERDRLIPEKFAHTDMGVDLLAQDYILKQLAASLTYPDDALGREFWNEVYARSGGVAETSDALSKVWVVPQEAHVYVHGSGAFIVESQMDVLLDRDYQTLDQRLDSAQVREASGDDIYLDVYRDKILPQIKKDVNAGAQFAALRQIYNATILAVWFKRNLAKSVLDQTYVGKNVVEGIAVDDKQYKEQLYERYLESFRKGAYNYIKEEIDESSRDVVPIKYFSGGVQLINLGASAGILHQSDDVSHAQKVYLAEPVIVEVEAALGWDGKPVPVGFGSDLSKAVGQGVSSGVITMPAAAGAVKSDTSSVRGRVDFDFSAPRSLPAQIPEVAEPKVATPVVQRFSFRRAMRPILVSVGLFLSAFLIAPAAKGATFERGPQGQVVAVVDADDTFGHIVEQMRVASKAADREAYEQSSLFGPMWGQKGAVQKASSNLRGSKSIHVIGDGDKLIFAPGVLSDSTVKALLPEVSSERVASSPVEKIKVPVIETMNPVPPAPVVSDTVTANPTVFPELGPSAPVEIAKEVLGHDNPLLKAFRETGSQLIPVVPQAPSVVLPQEKVVDISTEGWEEEVVDIAIADGLFPEEAAPVDPDGKSDPVASGATVEAPAKGWIDRARDFVASLHVGSLGWFQGIAAAGLLALTILRLTGQKKMTQGASVSASEDDLRDQALRKVFRQRLEKLASYRGHLRARTQEITSAFALSYAAQIEAAGFSLSKDNKADMVRAFAEVMGLPLERAFMSRSSYSAFKDRVNGKATELAAKFKNPQGMERQISTAMEEFVHAELLPVIEADIERVAQQFGKEFFTSEWEGVYYQAIATHVERYKLFHKNLSVTEAAREAADEIRKFMKGNGLYRNKSFSDDETPVSEELSKAIEDIDPVKGPEAIGGESAWGEDVLVMGASAAVSIVSGSDGMGTLLMTGLAPIIYRAGLVVALWFHELGHTLRAGPRAFTAQNVRGNLAFRDWLKILVPFYGRLPKQGELRVDVYDTGSREDAKIRRAGILG